MQLQQIKQQRQHRAGRRERGDTGIRRRVMKRRVTLSEGAGLFICLLALVLVCVVLTGVEMIFLA